MSLKEACDIFICISKPTVKSPFLPEETPHFISPQRSNSVNTPLKHPVFIVFAWWKEMLKLNSHEHLSFFNLFMLPKPAARSPNLSLIRELFYPPINWLGNQSKK